MNSLSVMLCLTLVRGLILKRVRITVDYIVYKLLNIFAL